MKRKSLLLALLLAGAVAAPVSAQYTDIINGITNTVMPAISGASSYKGYVEGSYTQGFGNYRTNFATVATSQGYKFTPWFYMGAGIGVDFLWSTVDDSWGESWEASNPGMYNKSRTTSAVMIPVFTDFRFIMGSQTSTSVFFNLRLGASFLCSDTYIQIKDGYLTSKEYFYFQPAFGVRFPINITNPKQAIDIGIHYRLMTSNYWSSWQYNAAINGLGLNLSFEW